MHGDRGSVVIDNDKLTFIHLTPRDGSAEERAYGAPGTAINQIADYPDASGAAEQTAGSNPGQLANRPTSPPIREFPRRACREDALRVDLETNRQSIAIITGVYESARTGRPVSL